MVVFPNCKINLGLNIVAKRTDGYHDLETVFYPVRLRDVLEITRAEKTGLYLSGLEVEGNPEDNLCMKAYRLLQKDFKDLPEVEIYLHKAIPMGAGMGGGSADGAFMLTLLNNKFNLQLTQQQLIDYALQLGSDCPFFIINSPVFAQGRGERMIPVSLDLSAYQIVIVNPGIHISTKEAFSKLIPARPEQSITEIIDRPVNEWKGLLVNDFEKPVFELYPAIEEVKETLYKAGAVYASMTGSGSTVFGLFKKDELIDITFPESYLHLNLPA